MAKTEVNLNISADSQPICTELSEQGPFFWISWNESKKCYAMIKAVENLNISVILNVAMKCPSMWVTPCYYNTETKIHMQMA